MTAGEYKALLLETSRTGGFPATDNITNRCKYLTSDGRRCAAGLLIPPDRYKPSIENLCAGHNRLFGGDMVDLIPDGLDVCDLESVQLAHDEQRHTGTWDHDKFSAHINTLECFKNA